MTEKPVSQVFEEAAEILEEKGWCQGCYQNDTGQHCAVGALGAVFSLNKEGIERNLYAEATPLAVAHRHMWKRLGHSIIIWNDTTGRTKTEVVDTLMGCAKELRNEGL